MATPGHLGLTGRPQVGSAHTAGRPPAVPDDLEFAPAQPPATLAQPVPGGVGDLEGEVGAGPGPDRDEHRSALPGPGATCAGTPAGVATTTMSTPSMRAAMTLGQSGPG